MKVSVVIPAYNEARTVGAVVEAARTHPLVSETIVVDDGSLDATGEVAGASGARVIALERNRGKAQALEAGVRAAVGDVLFFIDADTTGLTHEMMSRALESVLAGECDMFVLVVDRKRWPSERISRHLPLLGGTRVLRREVWEAVPTGYKKRFQIELALNYFARRAGRRVCHAMIPGLGHILKEDKRGLLHGLYQRAFMIRDIVLVMIKLHIIIDQVWTRPDSNR